MSNLKKMSLSQYITDSIKIAKSFHIYFDTLKKQASIITFKLYGYIVDDDKNKYNLNMAGKISEIDTPLTFNLDNNEVYLTPELVKKNEFLKESLLDFDNYYNTLVTNNPHLATYIKGCIADIPLNKILNAKDGEILWYNENLLQNGRHTIIKNVQEFIYSFLAVYHNPDYVVDELYAAGIISNLYSILPMVILVEKLKYAKTYNADDFHIYNYFKSYKSLSDEVDILDRKTLIWLYGNLDLLKTFIGQNETLDSVLNNVMDSLGLGVGRMYAEKTVPVISKNPNNIREIYYTKGIRVKQFKLNKSFSLNNGKVEKADNVVLREYEQNYIKDKAQIEVEDKDLNYSLKYSIPTKELSKILPIDDIILTNPDDINKFAYFINSLIYQTSTSNSKATLNFFNPSDGIVYKLNSAQIMVLFLKLTFKIFNINNNPIINNLHYANVLDLEAVKNFNINNYKLNDEEKIIVKEMLKDLSKLPNEITTISSFRKYFSISYNILHKFWYYLSNMNDVIYSTDLLFVLNSLFSSGSSTFVNNKSIKELQTETKLLIKDIPSESIIPTFKRLLETIIGEDIYRVDRIKSYLNKILKIGEKLTSYTVQFLYSNSLSYVITGHYQTLKPFLGRKSYLTVSDATYKMYEHVDKELINKNIPMLNVLTNREITNIFRMYKPCKLQIVDMNNRTMLTDESGIMFIKTGNIFPHLMKPDTSANSIASAGEIKTSDVTITQLYVGYPLGVSGYTEIIGNESFIINKDGFRFPNVYKPESIIINGYYDTKLNINDVTNNKMLGDTKLKLINYDNITAPMYNISLHKTIPGNYKPISKFKDIGSDDIKISDNEINKIFKPYIPKLINYYNITTGASKLKSNLPLNNYTPDILPYNGISDNISLQNRDNTIKNILTNRPYMKNVPEIMGERSDISIYKVNNFTPDSKGINPFENIVYKDIINSKNTSDRKPSIAKVEEITTGSSRINYKNIRFMTPSTINYDATSDKVTEQMRDNTINKYSLNRPIMKNIPELTNERSDLITSKVNIFSPDGKGVDPFEDIVYKNTDTNKSKPDKRLSITKVEEITTGNSRVNYQNIKFMTPSTISYDAVSDKVIEQTRDNTINKHKLSNPIVKNIPELTTERSDVVTSKVNSFSPDGKGVDPFEDIVYKDAIVAKKKLDKKPTISKVNEITTINSNINTENIKFMTPSTISYDAISDKVIEQTKNNTTIKHNISNPVVKNIPELTTERSDVVTSTVSMFSPKAKGSDPSDDIVYKTTEVNKKIDIEKLDITQTPEIMSQYSTLNTSAVKLYSPIPLMFNEEFYQKETHGRGNVQQLNNPILAQTPEITRPDRTNINNNGKTGMFNPETNGVDPSDDVAENTTKAVKIRNIEEPTIRVVKHEEIEDIPIIKIKH